VLHRLVLLPAPPRRRLSLAYRWAPESLRRGSASRQRGSRGGRRQRNAVSQALALLLALTLALALGRVLLQLQRRRPLDIDVVRAAVER